MTRIKSIQIFMIWSIFSVIMVFACPSQGWSQEKFKLKEGAKGRLCLDCHKDVQKSMKGLSVHPLLKKGDCTQCHEPHSGTYENLLTANPDQLCSGCHRDVISDKIKEKAVSIHPAVSQGNCVACHEPHGTTNKFILRKAGNELCLDCHKLTGPEESEVRFPHEPVKKGKGCLNCHDPHASSKATSLLKYDLSSLCAKCHKATDAFFVKKHLQYPVTNTSCTSCHNAHGSNNKRMLFDTVHAPVAEKKCSKCHLGPGSKNPLKVKNSGVASCEPCHKNMIKETFDKNRVHWPLLDKDSCLNCHDPHGSKYKSLVKGSNNKVCGKCHSDTVELQEWSKNNPKNKKLCEPVKSGNCTRCHNPHGSDNILYITQKDISFGLCGECHKWETHATHPIGEKIIDQRNKTLTMGCLSCHKACGTSNNPIMMHFNTTYELCVQCHVERKR